MLITKLYKILNIHNILSILSTNSMYDVDVTFKYRLGVLYKYTSENFKMYKAQINLLLNKYNVEFANNNVIKYKETKDNKKSNEELKEIYANFYKEIDNLENMDIEIPINKIKFDKNFKYLKINQYALFDDFIDFSPLNDKEEINTQKVIKC